MLFRSGDNAASSCLTLRARENAHHAPQSVLRTLRARARAVGTRRARRRGERAPSRTLRTPTAIEISKISIHPFPRVRLLNARARARVDPERHIPCRSAPSAPDNRRCGACVAQSHINRQRVSSLKIAFATAPRRAPLRASASPRTAAEVSSVTRAPSLASLAHLEPFPVESSRHIGASRRVRRRRRARATPRSRRTPRTRARIGERDEGRHRAPWRTPRIRWRRPCAGWTRRCVARGGADSLETTRETRETRVREATRDARLTMRFARSFSSTQNIRSEEHTSELQSH